MLYTRAEHGSLPVTFSEGLWCLGDGRSFARKHELLRAAAGGRKHWSFGSYFRLSPRLTEPVPDLTEVWASWSPAPRRPRSIGIDLGKRHQEVRRLVSKGFGAKIRASGYSFEDVLQEVYLGLQVRNRGKCPFDPAKSSFGHYVWMVAECVIRNHHRKAQRISVESAGLKGVDGELEDVADSSVLGSVGNQGVYDLVQGVLGTMSSARPKDSRTVERVLKGYLEGQSVTAPKRILQEVRRTALQSSSTRLF